MDEDELKFGLCILLYRRRRPCCELACSTMVGRFSGTLPTRVQILVLTFFLVIFLEFTGVTRYVSGKRR